MLSSFKALASLTNLFSVTHALARLGTGSTTALADTQIGADIVMPAGGPWIIHGLWGQVVKVTAVASEGTGGALVINSVSGDLDPDPAPGLWPMIGNPQASSANFSLAALPLNIWPVNLTAAGKAVIELRYIQQLAITAASATAAGIIFGDSIPGPFRAPFCDTVRAAFASATEQSIGEIVISQKASKITGIFADVNHGDALTAAEPVLATIRLASDDIQMPPSQYPCFRCFDSGDGTVEGETACPQGQFIPVDIPVVGGSRIDVFATTSQSVTGNAEVLVYLAYE